MIRARVLWLVLVVVLALGCEAADATLRGSAVADSDGGGEVDDDTSGFDPKTDSGDDSGADGCAGLNLLFVIDDSASMTSVKSNLIANFPRFVDVLEEYSASKGGQLPIRAAVTTASVDRNFRAAVPGALEDNPFTTIGANGVFLGRNECGLTDPWITGPGGSFEQQFTCLANVRTDQSSNIEMPFAAMEQALGPQSESGAPNDGFYTKHGASLLAVVVITNEEDCSIDEDGRFVWTGTGMCDAELSEGLYSPARIKTILEETTGGQGRYVLVAIAGPGPGKCQSVFGEAWDAIRIRETVAELGEYGVFGSLCENDLWLSLEQALFTIKASCDTMPPIV